MKVKQGPWWEVLITKNPMMAEVNRFRKRFLSIRGSSVAINGGIGIVLVLYALFAMICVYYRGDIEPIMLLGLFIVLMLLAIPLLLHGAISGERERRSWDMLMVAPITHAQIIVGKFMGAFAGLGMAFGLFMIPVVIDAAFHSESQFVNVLLASIVVMAQGGSLIAMTLLISSRVKRPLIALAVSIGVVMIYFVVFPTVISSATFVLGEFLTTIISPFLVLYRLALNTPAHQNDYFLVRNEGQSLDVFVVTFCHIGYQVVLTICLLMWATKTLVFADHEVKFIPNKKKKNHA
ncbi:MAG: ABC transporter permease [Armatimonadota bacterium]